jgi:hypothetical protein
MKVNPLVFPWAFLWGKENIHSFTLIKWKNFKGKAFPKEVGCNHASFKRKGVASFLYSRARVNQHPPGMDREWTPNAPLEVQNVQNISPKYMEESSILLEKKMNSAKGRPEVWQCFCIAYNNKYMHTECWGMSSLPA